MTATNHALTGAVIGLAVTNPWLALPAALLSHVACDAIPHYGNKNRHIESKGFARYLAVDALLCVALVVVLFLSGNPHWWLASLCAFLATSPDLLWIRRFMLARQHKPYKPNWLERFLKNIQWFEKPSGAIVEAAWFIAFGYLLILLLR